MTFVETWMGEYFWWIAALAVIALVWTVITFRNRRNFQSGPMKGEAINPRKVRRQNPPD
jgi:hypothetical protein